MGRVPTDQLTLLNAVVAQLVDQLSLNAETCFISDDPVPEYWPGDPTITVTTVDGTFPEGFLAGGGVNTAAEYTGIAVNVFTRNMLDEAGHAQQITATLLTLKLQVLKALTMFDPTNDDGNNILRNLMAPERSVRIQETEIDGNRAHFFSLVFTTDFDWDLS